MIAIVALRTSCTLYVQTYSIFSLDNHPSTITRQSLDTLTYSLPAYLTHPLTRRLFFLTLNSALVVSTPRPFFTRHTSHHPNLMGTDHDAFPSLAQLCYTGAAPVLAPPPAPRFPVSQQEPPRLSDTPVQSSSKTSIVCSTCPKNTSSTLSYTHPHRIIQPWRLVIRPRETHPRALLRRATR